MDRVTIVLPLPDGKLHAHAKGHWRPKAAATKALRELAHGLSIQAVGRNRKRWSKAVASICFWWPDNRRRDNLNAAHGLKAAIDGIVDAGVITDDCWQVLTIGGISSGVDRENPRAEITITNGGAA